MPNIGPFELIVILVIALVIIGPGRLPDVGAALGKSIREFRKASSDISESARVDTSPLPPAATTAAPVTPSAAPAPTPELSVPTPTASTVPGPIAAPPAPAADDEPTNLPA